MRNVLSRANQCFAAGALAGFLLSLVIWLAGLFGLFLMLGIGFIPQLTPGWMYQRVAWGGLWGLLFATPLLASLKPWRRGLVLSLFPAAAALLIFNPYKDGLGFFGLAMGPAWPFIVLFFNLLWGAMAGLWLQMSADSPPVSADDAAST
ncbi:MAG: hypothetical protein HY423_07375 [Candidatus Lambdaproteobacteria bacterium]|nr:hypothetical protein [Candidatus Lambdaproteobacteria bacterium]